MLQKLMAFVKVLNASGDNDGAATLIMANGAADKNGRSPIAKVAVGLPAGEASRFTGFGPAPASKKEIARLDLIEALFAEIELKEVLSTLRDLGISGNGPCVNPLVMSGARIKGTGMWS
ncbi:MAG: hypothetical protein ACRBBT_05910 [Paracoccaceae bacterium]